MEKAWASLGAIFAFLGFIQGLINTFLPSSEVSSACRRLGVRLFDALFSGHVEYTVEEYDGSKTNELYAAVQLHLSDKAASNARRLKLTQPKNTSALTCSLGEHQRVLDVYEGVKIWWEFSSDERKHGMPIRPWQAIQDERRSLHMQIRRSDRDKILSGYLPHLLANAKALKLKRRDRLLYTNLKGPSNDWGSGRKLWDSVPFNHPATFRSLALDPAFKQKIIDDLTDFANGEQFYKDAGRAWKRGYLLYGPPGTGKSSMIAAMANFLEYDVYDLELTEVKSNASLRSLLLNTSNKAIIVIEDIDCSLDFSERKKKKKKEDSDAESKPPVPSSEEKGSEVTLSGLLNFTDGLWSSCGSERIFVFTTNHVKKLDAALLRSGRMDMHIHLSYCGFEAFKVLAKNYLKLEEHALFEEVQAAMQEEGVRITPADVSEVMTSEKRNPEQALRCLIQKIRESKFKKQESEEEQEEEEEAKEEKKDVISKAEDESPVKTEYTKAVKSEKAAEEEKKEVTSRAEDESPVKTEDTKAVKRDEIEEEKKEVSMKAEAESSVEAGDCKEAKLNDEIEEEKKGVKKIKAEAETPVSTGDAKVAKNENIEEEKEEVSNKADEESPGATKDTSGAKNEEIEEEKEEVSPSKAEAKPP